MPIKIPATLPAFDVLTREGVMVMDLMRRFIRIFGLCALAC